MGVDSIDLKSAAHVAHPHHRFSVMVQERILIWLNMRCWGLTHGTPRGRSVRPLPYPSLTPHPLRSHWRPSPPHPPRLLHLPLLQLQSSLRRWGEGCRQRRAPHSWGWQRGRLPRYTSSSTWLLSCCLTLTAPWEWWRTHPLTNLRCCVAPQIVTVQLLCNCGEPSYEKKNRFSALMKLNRVLTVVE